MVALGGIVAAIVLSVLLITGLVQLNQAQQQSKMYKDYAMSLQEENAGLRDTYSASYDQEEVREIALAMGMIPSEQAPQMQMQVVQPQQIQEPTPWESFWTFVVGMFA